MKGMFANPTRTRPKFPTQEVSDWLAHPTNLIVALIGLIALVCLLMAATAAFAPHPAHAQAQAAGGDAATILQAAVTYFEGTFGIALASVGLIIIAILLFVGQHRYESMLLAVVAIALYFGGPGLIAAIAG